MRCRRKNRWGAAAQRPAKCRKRPARPARALAQQLIASEALPVGGTALGLVQWEAHELEQLRDDCTMPDTDRQAIVLARLGQGLFKQRVMRLERACRITGVTVD